jgi:hypothetical protein
MTNRLTSLNSLCNAMWRQAVGEPYAGNPHVRFDEGELTVGASGPGGQLPTLLVIFPREDLRPGPNNYVHAPGKEDRIEMTRPGWISSSPLATVWRGKAAGAHGSRSSS